MSLWIRLCIPTYIHTYIHTYSSKSPVCVVLGFFWGLTLLLCGCFVIVRGVAYATFFCNSGLIHSLLAAVCVGC